jgi:hypothetical protein
MEFLSHHDRSSLPNNMDHDTFYTLLRDSLLLPTNVLNFGAQPGGLGVCPRSHNLKLCEARLKVKPITVLLRNPAYH